MKNMLFKPRIDLLNANFQNFSYKTMFTISDFQTVQKHGVGVLDTKNRV